MYFLYSLLFTLGLVFTAPYYLWRLRGKITSGAGWRERFGFFPPSIRTAAEESPAGPIWIHAVSVGETSAVAPLVQELLNRYPERKIFMSHVTLAGRETGEKRVPGVAGHFFLPLDWGRSVRRVIRCLRPSVLLIVETELWPNLLRSAHQFGARVALVNARLSERSFRGYRLFRPFMRRVLNCVDWIGAQTLNDSQRFLLLGARPDRVSVTGNLKFEGKPPQSGILTDLVRGALKLAERGPVMVAASTMAGEEPGLLRAGEEIRKHHRRGLLILAPRHPARFDRVAQLLSDAGRTFVRRTALPASGHVPGRSLASEEILLLDTIGELAGIFEIADVVFVGGSLVPTGGHNLLEPAFWAKPVLFGPHMENFRDVARLFSDAGAGVQIHSPAELARAALDLLQDEPRRRRMGEAARRILEQESGATERVLSRLREWLEAPQLARAGVVGSEGR